MVSLGWLKEVKVHFFVISVRFSFGMLKPNLTVMLSLEQLILVQIWCVTFAKVYIPVWSCIHWVLCFFMIHAMNILLLFFWLVICFYIYQWLGKQQICFSIGLQWLYLWLLMFCCISTLLLPEKWSFAFLRLQFFLVHRKNDTVPYGCKRIT